LPRPYIKARQKMSDQLHNLVQTSQKHIPFHGHVHVHVHIILFQANQINLSQSDALTPN
jgi:hypothetical protein